MKLKEAKQIAKYVLRHIAGEDYVRVSERDNQRHMLRHANRLAQTFMTITEISRKRI